MDTIIESQNCLGWKIPLRLSPTIILTLQNPTKPCPQTLPLQGWRLYHFPGQLVSIHDKPFHEKEEKKIFPNIPSRPSLAQLEAVSSSPYCLGEKTNTQLATTWFLIQSIIGSKMLKIQAKIVIVSYPLSAYNSCVCVEQERLYIVKS